jgi:hypothetical protein
MHLLTLIFLANSVSSQIKQNIAKNISLSAITTTKGTVACLSLGLLKNKSSLTFGPSIGLTHVRSNNIYGMNLEYHYFPNGYNSNKFNFNFLVNFQYFHFKDQNFSLLTNIYQASIGQGFEYKLSQKVYFFQNWTLGILVETKSNSFAVDRTNEVFGAGSINFGVSYGL